MFRRITALTGKTFNPMQRWDINHKIILSKK